MPRRSDYTRRRSQLSAAERRRRNSRYSVYRSDSFVDMNPGVQGTLPEKMVYAKLIQFGFDFQFQTSYRAKIPDIGFSKDYRPDFILPNEKIIIEVQGSYWHSQPKAIEADAFKFAVYQTLGFKVVAWWDYDIYDHLDQLFIDEPRLAPRARMGKRLVTGREVNRDDSAGIRTLNSKRVQRYLYKHAPREKRRRTGRKALSTRAIF